MRILYFESCLDKTIEMNRAYPRFCATQHCFLSLNKKFNGVSNVKLAFDLFQIDNSYDNFRRSLYRILYNLFYNLKVYLSALICSLQVFSWLRQGIPLALLKGLL